MNPLPGLKHEVFDFYGNKYLNYKDAPFKLLCSIWALLPPAIFPSVLRWINDTQIATLI